MGLSESILKLASKVNVELGGVDWTSLEAKLGIPREEIVYHTGEEVSDSGFAMYWQYLQAAQARAKKALEDNGIVMSWQVTEDPNTSESEVVEAMRAWDAVQLETVDVSDIVLSAIDSNIAFLSTEDSFRIEREKLRAMVSSVYMVSLYGSVGHKEAIMQSASVAPEDIVESADNIVKSFNALTHLVEVGALNALKKPSDESTALGVEPGTVLVVISVVVAICVIAWCIVAVAKQIKVNKAIEQLCTEAVRTGSSKDKARCSALVEMNLTATDGGPTIEPIRDLKGILIASAVLVGLVILGPPLMRNFSREAK